MSARVFAAVHGTDTGRLTAAERAERLRVSPAAVSGAGRFLLQFNMIRREREPGSRRDVFIVEDDSWNEASLNRDEVITRRHTSARDGFVLFGMRLLFCLLWLFHSVLSVPAPVRARPARRVSSPG